MKKIAILQSNYIPWKGYFDMIAAVDEFVLYDVIQFTKNDWRNRNIIKTPQGPQWLTVPVGQDIHRLICEVALPPDGRWRAKHWKTLAQNYHKAPYFAEVAAWLEPLYHEPYTLLSELNRRFLEEICRYLGIRTVLGDARAYTLIPGRNERLIDICRQSGAGEYITGPAARCYVNEQLFADSGIKLTWFDYEGYRPYPQLFGAFEPAVSIVDLLFNCGPESPSYLRYVRP
jgi:hypothetical protein